MISQHTEHIFTFVGAIAEVVGLPLAIFDYGWHKRAHELEVWLHSVAGISFSKVWDWFYAVFGGGKYGKLNAANVVLAIGVWGIAAWRFVAVRHRGAGWGSAIAVGAGAWVASVLAIPVGLTVLSNILSILDKPSKGRPLGLFGVLLACVGLLVSLLHVYEIIAEWQHWA